MPKLTQSLVKSITLRPGELQTFFMDDELSGFGLRVSQTKKVFYLQMRLGNRVVKRKIGEYGILSVDQARKAALQLKAQLLSGNDPHADRQKGAKASTLGDLIDEYAKEVAHKEVTRVSIERCKKKFDALEGKAYKTMPNSRSSDDIELIKVKLSNWLNRPYREITQNEVLDRFDVLSRMIPARVLSKKPQPIVRTANQAFKYLQAAYNYAIKKNALAKNGFENPVDILKMTRRWSRINRRDSFLDINKPYFVKWWRACENYESKVIGDYLQFTLLMAGRSIECATLRWEDVDLKKGIVVFRNTKNSLDYTFPIPPLARAILERRLKEKGNDFVFGYDGSATGRVVCPPQHAIKKIREECGEHWTMHDLRRTFTTAMTSLNVHAFTIAHLMKHSPTITMTLSYAPPTREQLLEAMTRLEEHLLERVKPRSWYVPHAT
ncbi:MAG: integrase family protein [Pseudomonadota bacterium]